MKPIYIADLILNNNTGGTVSLIEIKSYPRISQMIRGKTLAQLESHAKRIDSESLRYLTVLSAATGYIKDIKTNKEIEFNTRPILEDYLDAEERKSVNPRLLNAAYLAWLRDLSFKLRKNLTDPEEKLKKFGFIDNIENTSPLVETPL